MFDSAKSQTASPAPLPLLVAQNLTREVDGKCLVDHVSVTINAGEIVAIVGPSGAGKSSLLRLFNRLDEPSSGTVLLNGSDYRSIAPRELRRRIGMVLQSPFLFPGTVAENLRYGPATRQEQISAEQIEQLLEQVQLAGYAERDVATLSGGEAQRVSLARTLANRPEVLLLDEPTSALDSSTRDEVEHTLQRIFVAQQLTCLMVTHDLAQAERLAQRAIALRAGRVVMVGTTEEVLHAGILDH